MIAENLGGDEKKKGELMTRWRDIDFETDCARNEKEIYEQSINKTTNLFSHPRAEQRENLSETINVLRMGV